MNYKLKPISLADAKAFTDAYHRHNVGSKGHKFSIGLEKDGELIGTATVGRPIARMLDDGYTAEVTRVCIKPNVDHRNANSMLYGACVRAAKAMGYEKVITYTLVTESGSSLKASGFQEDGIIKGHPNGWDMPGRHRTKPSKYPDGDKVRWVHT